MEKEGADRFGSGAFPSMHRGMGASVLGAGEEMGGVGKTAPC